MYFSEKIGAQGYVIMGPKTFLLQHLKKIILMGWLLTITMIFPPSRTNVNSLIICNLFYSGPSYRGVIAIFSSNFHIFLRLFFDFTIFLSNYFLFIFISIFFQLVCKFLSMNSRLKILTLHQFYAPSRLWYKFKLVDKLFCFIAC